MNDYVLQANEAVLYKGSANFKSEDVNKQCDIILTNLNLVAIVKTKKLFQKEQVEIIIYSISDVKIYDGVPQLKQTGNSVQLYFTNAEVNLNFDSKLALLKFTTAANKLLTGKSISERGAEKFKGAINLVDDTLGIKSVDTIKGVVENGVVGAIFGGLGKKTKSPVRSTPTEKMLVGTVEVTKNLINDTSTVNQSTKQNDIQEISLEEKIETLKKLKELVDAGILTQEEFDMKKKQIMEL